MAREILFKAKRIDNGKWVEGYYIYHIKRTPCVLNDCVKPEDEQHVIMCDGFSDWNMPRDTVHYDIDPNTLCQYTGLTNKNGNKIWEHDIVRYSDEVINKVKEDLIVWHEIYASFCRLHESKMGLQYLLINENISKECEVIGNIFDNPELLGGGE